MKRLPGTVRNVTDPAAIFQNQYSDEAQVNKSAEAGLNWKPLGAIGAKTRVEPGTPLMIFNSANAIAYVITGDTDAVAAPTGPANGIPVPAGEIIFLNSGLDSYVIASAATVFAYAPEFYEKED